MSNNIFSFYGADEKVGTTMVTQMIADRLAEKYPGKKVLYLHLSGRAGTDFTTQVFVWCIDDLKPRLMSGCFKEDDFGSFCEKKTNLETLRGSKSYLDRKLYRPEQIVSFLETVSPLYDVVIIDAGGDIDNGMVLGSLLATKNNFLVTGQLRKSMAMFKTISEQILNQIELNFDGAIINKFIGHPDLPDDATIESQLNIPVIGTIPFSNHGLVAEMEQRTLLSYKEKGIREAVEKICKKIEATAELLPEKQIDKGFRLFGKGR